MRTIEGTRRSAVSIKSDQTVQEAAVLMERSAVGALAVTDGEALVGIVTDRDLVRRAMARGLTLEARVDGVMTAPVLTIDADADMHDAYSIFRSNAVRRLAVMKDDRFVGMLTVDDLLIDLSADLSDLARPVTAEVLFGHRDPQVPATT